MVVRHEPGPQPRHVASCVGVAFRAFPPRRIVEVAGGLASLGASISLQSICEPGLAPAFDDLLTTAARLRGGLCIGFAPAGGPEGVACELRETLPLGVQCARPALRAAAGRGVVPRGPRGPDRPAGSAWDLRLTSAVARSNEVILG